ncbi:MAG: signal peptidase I [Candidatus Omnitrophica bacterium]|nr:signal peptidase I [Candidatus Omnitrophota bacterium]
MSVKVSLPVRQAGKYQGVRKKSEIREWIEALLVAAFLAFCIIRPFVAQAFKIPTGSMRQTLLEGDIILVNKFIYGAKVPFTDLRLPALRQPKRGDVIVFIYPQDPKKFFIKRLVAFSGETVEIRDGTIYINGRPLLDPVFSQKYYYNRGKFAQEGEKILVPAESFFVLGDNSASSQDSRYWGFVPGENILGEAVVIYWPPRRIRIIK